MRPMSLQQLGIRARLVLLVLSCVLPMIAAVGFLMVQFYAQQRAQLLSTATSRVRAIVSALDREFAITEASLLTLSSSQHLDDDLTVFHQRALATMRQLGAQSIVVLEPGGQLLLSTRRPYGSVLPRLAAPPLLARTLASGRPGVSDLFIGPIDKQYLFTVAVPVFRDGVAALSLNATFSPEHLAGLLDEQKMPASWRAAIVDSKQTVVFRNKAQQRYVGHPVGPALRQTMASQPEGDVETTTLDGIAVQTFFSRSPATGWSVVIGVPQDELTAGLRTHLLGLIGVGTAALLAGLLLAGLLGRRLSASVRMLRDEAGALGRGDIPRLPELGFREARELGQAMVDAALRLKVAQDGLRESERRFSLVTQATGVGLWISEAGVEQLWASETWRTIFGFDPGEPVLRAALPARIHPDERDAVMAGFGHALEVGQSYEAEFRVCLPDGSLRWVSARGQAELADGGRALMRGAAFDITARKSAELALENKQQQLIHLARVSMLGELAGALAHELNQPLTAILSNAQAALRFMRRDGVELGAVSREVIDILQDIVDEDKHAGAVIRRLRTLLRPGETSAQYIDVNALVREAVRLVRSELRQRGVELRTELAEPLPSAVADPVQLQQVLINLLVNAGDALAQTAPGQRLVVVSTAVQDGAIRVSVRDVGSGLAPAVLAHIFDPFFTTKPQGMGLGLSICRTIIEANGGSLWAENNPGPGAVFSFTVPLASGLL